MNKEAPELFRALSAHPAENPQAMDFSHALFIAGLVAAHKPSTLLELGVGSGYLTRVLLAAAAANLRGEVTSVDNFIDWNGVEPDHIRALRKEFSTWNLVLSDESKFVREGPAEAYDCVISDGDHPRGYQNAPHVFRLCRLGGVMVFHDTNSELFSVLARLPGRCRQLGFPCAHFTAQSRPDEKTGRGMLVVWKNQARPFTLDLPTRLYLCYRDSLPSSFRNWLRRAR